ncbi:MAG: winged helix-turn-helix transcriptional regulator [Alphaproteobacteria bacterium]|nr:winged helix-turn-helix transcriptional regulator [Alphaproteobacteria bacterium]
MVVTEAALDALGNGTRRAIVGLLREGPSTVGQIAARLPVSRPAVSQHLRVLEDAALVAHVPDGTRNVYRLDPAGFDAMRDWLDALWAEALPRFAALAASTWEDDHE